MRTAHIAEEAIHSRSNHRDLSMQASSPRETIGKWRAKKERARGCKVKRSEAADVETPGDVLVDKAICDPSASLVSVVPRPPGQSEGRGLNGSKAADTG